MGDKKLETISARAFGETIVGNLKDSIKYQAIGIAISGVICLGYNAYANYKNNKTTE